MAAEETKAKVPAGRRVTAEALAVAPDVLGLPLAEPWRRLAAMLIDLGAVSALSLLSGPWLGLGTARRGWIQAGHVLNARSVDEVRAFVARKRAAR